MSKNLHTPAVVSELKAFGKYTLIGYGMILSMVTLGWIMSRPNSWAWWSLVG